MEVWSSNRLLIQETLDQQLKAQLWRFREIFKSLEVALLGKHQRAFRMFGKKLSFWLRISASLSIGSLLVLSFDAPEGVFLTQINAQVGK